MIERQRQDTVLHRGDWQRGTPATASRRVARVMHQRVEIGGTRRVQVWQHPDVAPLDGGEIVDAVPNEELVADYGVISGEEVVYDVARVATNGAGAIVAVLALTQSTFCCDPVLVSI